MQMLALLAVDGSLAIEKEEDRWFARIVRADGSRQLSVVTDEEREQLEKYLAGELREPEPRVAETAAVVEAPEPPDVPPTEQLTAWLSRVELKATGLKVYVDEGWRSVSFELEGADDPGSPTIEIFEREGRGSARRTEELITRLAHLLGGEPVLSAMRRVAAEEAKFRVSVVGPYGKQLWSYRIRL